MTGIAQRSAVHGAGQLSDQISHVVPVRVDESREWNDVVDLKPNLSSLGRMSAAFLASVVVALQTCAAPILVFLCMSQLFLELRNTAAPIPVFGLGRMTSSDSSLGLFGPGVVANKELRNTNAVVANEDRDHAGASTLAEVLPLLGRNPRIPDALIGVERMLTGVLAFQLPTFSESTASISFAGIKHDSHDSDDMKWNGVCQANRVNCWKPPRVMARAISSQAQRMASAERHVVAKVQRLVGEEPTNKPTNSARRESDDIVLATSNSGRQVMALKWNGASITVDQYSPSGVIYGLNTKHVQLWISTLPKYQFGFTGWKEAQNTDDVAGQFLFAGNLMIPAPRLFFKITGVTG